MASARRNGVIPQSRIPIKNTEPREDRPDNSKVRGRSPKTQTTGLGVSALKRSGCIEEERKTAAAARAKRLEDHWGRYVPITKEVKKKNCS